MCFHKYIHWMRNWPTTYWKNNNLVHREINLLMPALYLSFHNRKGFELCDAYFALSHKHNLSGDCC